MTDLTPLRDKISNLLPSKTTTRDFRQGYRSAIIEALEVIDEAMKKEVPK